MPNHVFISYSHQDEEFVLRLARQLEERGAEVWIDRGDIHAGAEWQRKIAQAVENCAAFLFVVSQNSVDSTYVAQEFALAKAHQKPVFPLIYRKTKIPDPLQEQLFNSQFIDFRTGSYQDNFTDILTGLLAVDIPLSDAPELSLEEQAERRRELLGAKRNVAWGDVFKRVPGWAFAWGLGWAIFWVVLPLLLLVTGSASEEITNAFLLYPFGGFVGGLVGGVWAGGITMLVLRHHAVSIAWKHMKAAIRIWGLVGPLGTVASALLAVALFTFTPRSVDCSQLSTVDCFTESMGMAFGNAIGAAIGMMFAILFYTFFLLLILGGFAGWLAVRHIRRLEPGILGKQAIWVILGWASGAILAVMASAMVFSLLER